MTMLESTISMLKVLPEADLVEIQHFAQKLLQRRTASGSLVPKSREDIYAELENSRQQILDGNYQDAEEFIAEVRSEYGI